MLLVHPTLHGRSGLCWLLACWSRGRCRRKKKREEARGFAGGTTSRSGVPVAVVLSYLEEKKAEGEWEEKKRRVLDSVGFSAGNGEREGGFAGGVLPETATVKERSGAANFLDELITRAKVALAMLASVTTPNDEVLRPGLGKMPSWVSSRDRKLMESLGKDIVANAVVAQDGTGKYRTLAEAVAAAPDKSKTRYVIYVKRGIYKENVEVSSRKTNLMIVGDGMYATIITGSLNVVDGSSTFRSATLAAVGKGFILQDICIQNTAGPAKHQAVALRVGADKSVINRCRIDAYQDTLYAHSQRQFYRDSYVTGTIDFIFGNAAVVFQKCQLVARKPSKHQQNMVTAQGRTDPNQATGTAIQFCDIIASPDLKPVVKEFPTYLGRPWKKYSRTVVMESYLGGLIDPSGWAEWHGDFALKTLYYGEFMNNGPGAGTSKRVKWPGYHVITDPAEAMPFTVAKLIQGGSWLRSTGVAYVDGLYD